MKEKINNFIKIIINIFLISILIIYMVVIIFIHISSNSNNILGIIFTLGYSITTLYLFRKKTKIHILATIITGIFLLWSLFCGSILETLLILGTLLGIIFFFKNENDENLIMRIQERIKEKVRVKKQNSENIKKEKEQVKQQKKIESMSPKQKLMYQAKEMLKQKKEIQREEEIEEHMNEYLDLHSIYIEIENKNSKYYNYSIDIYTEFDIINKFYDIFQKTNKMKDYLKSKKLDVPKNYLQLKKEIKRNKEYVEVMQQLCMEYMHNDSNCIFITDITEEHWYIVQLKIARDAIWTNDRNKIYDIIKEYAEQLKKLNPELKNYTDLFGNNIIFRKANTTQDTD